jgi:hypothetical protein
MFIIAIFILGFFTMLLWNALIPDIFRGPELSYLQAVGLLVLTRILVGIRGGRHWWKPWHWFGRHKWSKKWQNAPKEEWMSEYCKPHGREWWEEWCKMSPEERRAAKQDWKASFKQGWEKQDSPE